ncbi:uncharacterized protein EMH_0002270 [Eimeria mitis]|uniref:Immune mapped protein 2 N-terminal domain-containing protein n=1 Tax=Eimeria mitis TaxID=44415 RepID=U6JZ71_9EIME|nr:uncharacterized protein EMH_0002270 [Eimeria mitis]CDJ28818.1 hypothetical protein, conserved [Eimeria mitis]
MGAVCGKPGAAAEPKTRKAAVEVSDSPPEPNVAQTSPVPAAAVCPKPETTDADATATAVAVDQAKEFITGDGDGVYLLMLQENNMPSLVQQYSHSKPEVAEGDMLLLQVKPPAAMKNADGQKKVCEAVMECLRLTFVYSGYIHAYAALAEAPFSVLLVVSERHEAAAIKESDDGYKIVGSAADEASQTNAGTEQTGEDAHKTEGSAAKTGGEAPAEGAGDENSAAKEQKEEAAPTASEGNEQQGETNDKEKKDKGDEKRTIFQDSSPEPADVTTAPKALDQMQVLRHVAEGRSPNFSLLQFIIVVPLTKPKAEETLKDGWVIDEENVEQLKKQVDKLHGVMIAAAQEKGAQ